MSARHGARAQCVGKQNRYPTLQACRVYLPGLQACIYPECPCLARTCMCLQRIHDQTHPLDHLGSQGMLVRTVQGSLHVAYAGTLSLLHT